MRETRTTGYVIGKVRIRSGLSGMQETQKEREAGRRRERCAEKSDRASCAFRSAVRVFVSEGGDEGGGGFRADASSESFMDPASVDGIRPGDGWDTSEFTRDRFQFEPLDTKYQQRLAWATLSFFPSLRCFLSDQKGAVDDLEMNSVRLFGGEGGRALGSQREPLSPFGRPGPRSSAQAAWVRSAAGPLV